MSKLLSVSITIFFSLILACKPSGIDETKSIGLEEITLSELRQGYEKGDFTIVQVVQEYLNRIEQLDKSGPGLNSVIYVNSKALQYAEELDRELADGKSRGPLHGIPVILKDNIDTYDMPTTAGSRALMDTYPGQDSWLAAKLREAGAIILGKANLSEWANFRGNLSSSGWSGLGGQTKNPYVLDRNPCGSSSGSGVAVSANLCAFAIGTETNGSIVCPANANGVVGLKPTVGLISRSGIIPISFTQDTAGPMGRTVEDVAISLGLMVGIDSADSKTIGSQGNYRTDYTQFLKPDGLKGKRIGLIKSTTSFHPKVKDLINKAVEDLKKSGAEVIEVDFVLDRTVNQSSYQVMLYEFKDGLNAYFQNRGNSTGIKNIDELIEFNKRDSIELMYFGQQLLEMASQKGDLEAKEYKDALQAMLKASREDGIDKVMNEFKLDALMAPTGSSAWKTDHINGDHYVGGSSSYAAISGYPNITVPMGFIDDMPVGVSFFGRAWSEGELITVAYGYEQATKHRRAPRFLATD